jgi:hypothetical protein
VVDANDATPIAVEGAKSEPRLRRPIRFSLRTVFLLVTLVALVISLWINSRELRQAKKEVQKLRDECGYLTILDAKKAHAIAVRRLGSLRWAWRIYLPADRQFRLCSSTKLVPAIGIPTDRGYSMLHRTGEFLLEAGVEKDERGQWKLCLQIPGHGESTGIGDWRDHASSWSSDGVGPGQTCSFEPGQSLVLLRLRVSEEVRHANGTIRRSPQGPADGLMIWIEEIPKP